MRVSDIRIVDLGDDCELQARVASDANPTEDEWFDPFVLWFRFPIWCRPYLTRGNGDPFLATLLLPAMRTGSRLVIDASVSPRLLRALPDLQAIYAAFDPAASRIDVDATAAERNPSGRPRPGNGLFFSLGIDSFYSLLKNARVHPADELSLTHLIYLHGVDHVRDGDDGRWPPAILVNLRRVAATTGTTLVPVATNVRQVLGQLVPWSMLHGGAMASVGLALGTLFRRLTIAASYTYDTLEPWGTHPLLDPLWSTAATTFVHDGCEFLRIDKTQRIIDSPLVLDTLRVCPGYGSAYNCGRCIKCLRTMLDLKAAGVLERCPTLPHEIDPDHLRIVLRMNSAEFGRRGWVRRLEALRSLGAPAELIAVLSERDGSVGDGRRGSPRATFNRAGFGNWFSERFALRPRGQDGERRHR